MIEEASYKIGDISKSLADIDITQSGSWVSVTDFSDADQSLYFGNRKIKLPEKVRFPFIRSIDEKTVLIVDSRIQVLNYEFEELEPGKSRLINRTFLNEKNAWIITASGEIKVNFSVDDAIEDVIITKDFIVVTQFDEAAIGGDGICVYDFQGNRLFNYHEVFGIKTVDICDCYAAALVKENEIIFCPYTEFPMVLFDIEAKSQQIWEIPETAQRFHAITKRGNNFYFHRVYRSELEGYDFGIYEWRIGSEEVRKVGEYQNHFTRGLPDGKFLAKNESGYVIINII